METKTPQVNLDEYDNELMIRTAELMKTFTRIMNRLHENSAKLYPPGAEMPLYASLSRMSQLYDMSRDKLERILAKPVKEGIIRVLRPKDKNGRVGNKSYHLKDFEDYCRDNNVKL